MAMHARVFQSALFRPCFTGAFCVHLGARVGAVVLLLADLRRLPPLPHLALHCLVRRDVLLSLVRRDTLLSSRPVLSGASHLRLLSFDAISGRSFYYRFKTTDRRFSTHRVGVFLFRFYLRGFPKRRLGVFLPPTGGPKHRPGFSRTPTGFQSGFRYLCTTFRAIDRGFRSGNFGLPTGFVPAHRQCFTRLFTSFSPYRVGDCSHSFPCNLCLSFPRRHKALVSPIPTLSSHGRLVRLLSRGLLLRASSSQMDLRLYDGRLTDYLGEAVVWTVIC